MKPLACHNNQRITSYKDIRKLHSSGKYIYVLTRYAQTNVNYFPFEFNTRKTQPQQLDGWLLRQSNQRETSQNKTIRDLTAKKLMRTQLELFLFPLNLIAEASLRFPQTFFL